MVSFWSNIKLRPNLSLKRSANGNPYAKKFKKQITIRIEEPTIDYFKNLATEMDVPYQTLMNLYLRDCVESARKLNLKWK